MSAPIFAVRVITLRRGLIRRCSPLESTGDGDADCCHRLSTIHAIVPTAKVHHPSWAMRWIGIGSVFGYRTRDSATYPVIMAAPVVNTAPLKATNRCAGRRLQDEYTRECQITTP